MIRGIQFTVGFVLLMALEVLRVYLVMPFPGSQESDTIDLAYFIHRNMFYLRAVAMLIMFFPIVQFFWMGKWQAKMLVTVCLLSYAIVYYVFNYKFQADATFHQPTRVAFKYAIDNQVPVDKLVLGLNVNGETKAFPIEIIGYHYQVRDTIGGKPVMITYSAISRSGRAYSPTVDGHVEDFRLVGMNHFNPLFEDGSTQSWWHQATGEAITGSHKGKTLPEIPCQQMTLQSWLNLHPESKILQPDSTFRSNYAALELYDEGLIQSSLVRKDTSAWANKSWIVGVKAGTESRAYDWNALLKARVINDVFNGKNIAVVIEPDNQSFHVLNRDSLTFTVDVKTGDLKDEQTGTIWSWQGKAIDGDLSGKQLEILQSYQEFWHSWKTFNPQTTQYPSVAESGR